MIKKLHLKWDSEFFGFNIAKYTISGFVNSDELQKSLSEEQHDALYIFTEYDLNPQIYEVLKENGAIKYDDKITYLKKTENKNVENMDISESNKVNYDIKTLAYNSGWCSRFI